MRGGYRSLKQPLRVPIIMSVMREVGRDAIDWRHQRPGIAMKYTEGRVLAVAVDLS